MSAPARSLFTSSVRVASKSAWRKPAQTLFQQCPGCRQISRTAIRRNGPQPIDDPSFKSLLDNPPVLVRVGGNKRHGPGLIILGKSFAQSVIRWAHFNNIYSFNTHHSLRPRHLASPTPDLEIRAHRTLRRPSRPRSPPITGSHRPRIRKRLRLSPCLRHRPLQTRPRNAHWSTYDGRQGWISCSHTIGERG